LQKQEEVKEETPQRAQKCTEGKVVDAR